MYRIITSPEHISAHELPLIEADMAPLSKDALTALVPSGHSLQQLRSALEKGDYLLLCDTPKLPLLLKNADTQGWYLNPSASTIMGTHLSHVIEPPPEEQHIPELMGMSGDTSLYQPTTAYSEVPTRSVKERLTKQRQDRADELAEESAKQRIQACFYYRKNKGTKGAFSVWSGEREYVADLPWRLTQNDKVIVTGKTDSNGRLMVDNLTDTRACVLEYGLPGDTALTKQKRVKINDYTHIELHSLVLAHFYDDTEHTPVWETPFLITLKNETTQTGTTDTNGTIVTGPFLSAVKSIEFYPDDPEESINDTLDTLNHDLVTKMDTYAQILADQVREQYQPSHTKEEQQIDEIRADFEQAVEDRINELKLQSLEYDAQAWYEKMWDLTLASKEGVVDGLSSYLPDLGAFGELLDEMKMDVDPLVVINAITQGDVDELEAAFKQWKQRNDAGYEEATAKMEVLIILLKDPHIRETLLSLPQRFLDVAPTDALVKLGVSQGSQMTVDSAAVFGATALGTAISGPGGFIAGGLATSGTLARKAASIAEEILGTLMSLSEALMKKRNKRTEPVSGHVHDSETKNEGKEPKKEPQNCKWHNCNTKHDKPPKYPNTGRTTRSSDYRKQWIKAGLEPWVLLGKGDALPAIFHDPNHEAWHLGFNEAPAPSSIKQMQDSATHPEAGEEYSLQAHHMILASALSSKQLAKLSENIKLIGWNVNQTNNAIFLPTLAPDMLRHGLQMHRGPHPDRYEVLIEAELDKIQTRCLSYCKGNKQKKLVSELNELTNDIRMYLKQWHSDYLLREDTLEIKTQLDTMLLQAKTTGEI